MKEFQETLEIYNTVGLDTVCFIYHLKRVAEFEILVLKDYL
ncbi:MAG: hypothetical protein ACUVV0_06095 [Anaerolineae bacterium]